METVTLDKVTNYPREISAIVSHPSMRSVVQRVRHYPRTKLSVLTLSNGYSLSIGYNVDGGIPHYCDPIKGTAEIAIKDRTGRLADIIGEGREPYSSVLPYASLCEIPALAYRWGRLRSRAVR